MGVTTLEKLALGQAAIDGYICECEPEVNAAPCRMCAVDSALKSAKHDLEALQRQSDELGRAVVSQHNEINSLRA